MYLKKAWRSAVVSAVVELPVHLELAVGVLVVVLVGLPAEREHAVADLGDHIVAAHQGLLVVAGLAPGCRRRRRWRLPSLARAGRTRTRRRSSCGSPASAARRDLALQHLARMARSTGWPSITRIAGEPADLGLPGQLDRGSPGSGMAKQVRIGRRHVEPRREAARSRRRRAGHAADGGRRHQLGAQAAEQIDVS